MALVAGSRLGPYGALPPNYDVTPDGRAFVVAQPGERDGLASELRVIVNWRGEIERRSRR